MNFHFQTLNSYQSDAPAVNWISYKKFITHYKKNLSCRSTWGDSDSCHYWWHWYVTLNLCLAPSSTERRSMGKFELQQMVYWWQRNELNICNVLFCLWWGMGSFILTIMMSHITGKITVYPKSHIRMFDCAVITTFRMHNWISVDVSWHNGGLVERVRCRGIMLHIVTGSVLRYGWMFG